MLENLLTPPLLFFALGFIATLVRSDLKVPGPIISFLSMYLMIGIGLQGGLELQHVAILSSLQAIAAGIAFGMVQPLIAYAVLRKGNIDRCNAGAIAAHYGSVSVGTFLCATAYLKAMGVSYGPYPLIMLAVMEAPAIVIGLLLINKGGRVLEQGAEKASKFAWGAVIHKAFTNSSVMLLLGSMTIGYVCSESAVSMVQPFYQEMFAGMLTLFLLAMGIEAASKLAAFEKAGPFLVGFGTIMPLIFGTIGTIVAALVLALPAGSAFLVGVLAASASYIAVPSAMRLAVPEANPSLYLTLSLGVTFPFNVLIGIPIYWAVVQALGIAG